MADGVGWMDGWMDGDDEEDSKEDLSAPPVLHHRDTRDLHAAMRENGRRLQLP